MTTEEYRAGCVLYRVHETGETGCPLLASQMCGKGRFACNFRKTAEQKAEDRKRWSKRLNSLPDDLQDFISVKYYFGKMPWKEEEKQDAEEI